MNNNNGNRNSDRFICVFAMRRLFRVLVFLIFSFNWIEKLMNKEYSFRISNLVLDLPLLTRDDNKQLFEENYGLVGLFLRR